MKLTLRSEGNTRLVADALCSNGWERLLGIDIGLELNPEKIASAGFVPVRQFADGSQESLMHKASSSSERLPDLREDGRDGLVLEHSSNQQRAPLIDGAATVDPAQIRKIIEAVRATFDPAYPKPRCQNLRKRAKANHPIRTRLIRETRAGTAIKAEALVGFIAYD